MHMYCTLSVSLRYLIFRRNLYGCRLFCFLRSLTPVHTSHWLGLCKPDFRSSIKGLKTKWSTGMNESNPVVSGGPTYSSICPLSSSVRHLGLSSILHASYPLTFPPSSHVRRLSSPFAFRPLSTHESRSTRRYPVIQLAYTVCHLGSL